jgi:hypothetical protein
MNMMEERLSKQLEREGMDMMEEHLSKQLEVEGMVMAGNHTEGVDMDTTEERLLKRPDVKGMHMADNHMVEDTTPDLERVERVHGDVVIADRKQFLCNLCVS